MFRLPVALYVFGINQIVWKYFRAVYIVRLYVGFYVWNL